ncbi:MAG: hypothetical protein ACLT98_00075 [Eggerthellaceae bacterium]
METVNRIGCRGSCSPWSSRSRTGTAHARFCLSQEKRRGSRRVEHRFHCVAFGPVAMAVAASLAPASPWCSRGSWPRRGRHRFSTAVRGGPRPAGRARSRYRLSSRSTR